MHRSVVALSAALFLAAPAAAAQDFVRALPPGLRVRVSADPLNDRPLAGRLSARDSAGLTLEVGGGAATVWLPASSVRMIELSEGRPWVNRSLKGAGLGAVAGVATALVAGAIADDPWIGLVGLPIGLVVGPLVGAPVAALTAPERWRVWGTRSAPSPDTGSVPLMVAVNPGSTLRVRPSGGRTERGTAARAGADSLVLDLDGRASRRVSYAWSDLDRVEIREGRDRSRGVLRGAAILGGVAVVFGGIDAARGELSGEEFVSGVVGNAVVGAAVGWFLAPRGWAPLPLAADAVRAPGPPLPAVPPAAGEAAAGAAGAFR